MTPNNAIQNPTKPNTLNNEEKIAIITDRMRDVLEALGLDLEDESLKKTPARIARMYVNEVFSGLDGDNFPKISFVPNKYQLEEHKGIIQIKASFTSFCEHHFVPMSGIAQVAYLPRKKLIGLSKIPRIVRHFAQRPQLQERLTAQIAECLSSLLETPDVAVVIKAQHHCVLTRGIEDGCSDTKTQVLLGDFQDPTYFGMVEKLE